MKMKQRMSVSLKILRVTKAGKMSPDVILCMLIGKRINYSQLLRNTKKTIEMIVYKNKL